MGKVYEGRDPRLGRKVAIKIVAGEFSDRFIREARAVAALNHPHICTHPGSQKILSRWKRTSNAGG
ncbi:MAG: hypothetical protein LAP40_27985 [Acidobacteriia bacterium]|nr:hypothetical protein [Terriglobia bacterium]